MPTQDLATRLQIGTERWTANELNKLIPMLNAVMKELVKVLVDVDPTAVKRTAYQIERYEKLVKEINKLTRKVYAQMYNQIDAAHIDFAATHAQLAKQTINVLASAEVAKLRLPESLLRSLVSDYNVIYGVPSAQYWTAHAEILADNFTRAVRHGMTLGESIGKIVDRVQSNTAYPGLRVPILESSRKKLEILVRTSTQSLANTTHNEVYKQNADILEGVEWVSTLDNRTTPICVGLDGLVWSLPDYKPLGHSKQYPGPTGHWGCFIAGTKVRAAGVLGKTKRLYSGDAFTIRTSTGNEVTCTPNHPILTDSGFIPAKDLVVGDKVFNSGVSDWLNSSAIHPNDEKVESLIEDVSVSPLGSCGVLPVSMPTSPHDFHGDGIGSEVAVVWTNSLLGSSENAKISNPLDKLFFISRLLSDVLLSRFSLFNSLTEGSFSIPGSFISSFDQPAPFFWGGFGHPNEHGLAWVSNADPVVNQSFFNNMASNTEGLSNSFDRFPLFVPGDNFIHREVDKLVFRPNFISGPSDNSPDSVGADAQLFSDLRRGLAGDIFLDDIVFINKISINEHVYNLETKDNYYIANGIITHNCRSTQTARIKNQRRPKRTTYQEWFANKSKAFQKDVLGPARYELYKQGKLDLRDMTDFKNRPFSVKELGGVLSE